MKKDLYLYNTAASRKEKFVPLRGNTVAIYCCGPTVYNYAHIGNLRTYIFEDVLKRVLLACGYDVRHVVNITDVGHLVSDADTGEDKMEKGAAREGKSVWDIAAFYTEKFMADIAALNVTQPDLWPKATEHIPQMIALVKSLEDKGFTYRTDDGLYFDTAKFPAYCDFARIDAEALRAGERVDMGGKRAPTDFALWKFSPKNEKRQMEWDSPWGTGFPGWHIECSAMSLAHLPQPLDIHCGGMDHIRVHHTNEIAQAEAATGQKFANFWLHGEFLVLDKGKMAKSGGNFVTLDTLKEKGITPLGYRMFCYTAHYRSPLTFSYEGAAAAEHGLANLRKIIAQLDKTDCQVSANDGLLDKNVRTLDKSKSQVEETGDTLDKSKSQPEETGDTLDKSKSQPEETGDTLDKCKSQAGETGNTLDKSKSQPDQNRLNQILEPFTDALRDDLNMPRAVAALWDALRDDSLTAAEKRAFAQEADKVLGLDLLKGADADGVTEIAEVVEGYKISISANGELPPELKNIIIEKAVQRKKSRAAKDFQAADKIRAEFTEAGVALKDLPDGATQCVVEDTLKAAGLKG